MSTRLSKDRASLCSFTFADGRRCRTPHSARHHFCTFHARKEAQAAAVQQIGRDPSTAGRYVSACDLSSALGKLHSEIAQGQVSRRTAKVLAYLSQTLAQTIPLAQQEYVNAFGAASWQQLVRGSFVPSPRNEKNSSIRSSHPRR